MSDLLVMNYSGELTFVKVKYRERPEILVEDVLNTKNQMMVFINIDLKKYFNLIIC